MINYHELSGWVRSLCVFSIFFVLFESILAFSVELHNSPIVEGSIFIGIEIPANWQPSLNLPSIQGALERAEQVEIWRYKIRRICWVRKHIPFYFFDGSPKLCVVSQCLRDYYFTAFQVLYPAKYNKLVAIVMEWRSVQPQETDQGGLTQLSEEVQVSHRDYQKAALAGLLSE